MRFLQKLLQMIRADDNGSRPGAKVRCPECGMVRVDELYAVPDPEGIRLWAFCPKCRGIVGSEPIQI